VRADVLVALAREELAQVGHADAPVAAHVDPTQESYPPLRRRGHHLEMLRSQRAHTEMPPAHAPKLVAGTWDRFPAWD
jgi:hypothetical protein